MAAAELAAVFDLLRITLGKTDQTRNKAEALSGLVHTAVERALQARDLAGDPTEITQIVLTTLRYITGGLLVHGELSTPSGLVMRPHQSVSKKFSALSRNAQQEESAGSGASSAQPSQQATSSRQTSSTAPAKERLDIVNEALAELGMAAIRTRTDIGKLTAANVKAVCAHLQETIDHDPMTGKDVDFLQDYVAGPGGVFQHSLSGKPTAADFMRHWISGA